MREKPFTAPLLFSIILFASAVSAQDTADNGMDEPAIPHPHPVLTEVLFNVPRGNAGDANKDGKRDPAGDEFVELYNPHDRDIQLRGYTITNWLTTDNPDEKRGVRFTFPRFKLPPGEVVVVFNGVGATIKGQVGTDKRAPRKPNNDFDGAWVFRTSNTSSNNAFNNSSDFVLITDPDGEKVEAAAWGKDDFSDQIGDALRVSDVSASPRGSVQRTDPENTDLWPHVDIDDEAWSPGIVPGLTDVKEETEEDQESIPSSSEQTE
ncbi:MAG: lamin tail domain-containing protein [Planctomycetota bacterium]